MTCGETCEDSCWPHSENVFPENSFILLCPLLPAAGMETDALGGSHRESLSFAMCCQHMGFPRWAKSPARGPSAQDRQTALQGSYKPTSQPTPDIPED